MPRKLLPYLSLLAAAVIWGISTPIAKIVLQQVPPLSLSFFRFLIALVVLLIIGSYLHIGDHIARRDLPKMIVMSLFAAALTIPLGFVGLNITSALDAITVSALTPIIVAVLGWWVLKEPLTRDNLLGQGLAVVGVVVALSAPDGPSPNRYLGDILILLSGVTWAVSVILAKELFSRYHAYTITTFIFMVGTIVLFPFASYEYLQDPTWVDHLTTVRILGIGFLGIATSVVAWLMFEWGLKRVTASDAGISYHVQLIAGALAALALLGETLSDIFLVGVVFIVIGILLATKHPHHHRLHHLRS